LRSDEVIRSCSSKDSLLIADFVRVEFLRASKGFASGLGGCLFNTGFGLIPWPKGKGGGRAILG
jgi:hypothetical protein